MIEKIIEKIVLRNPISNPIKVTYEENYKNWRIENLNYVGFSSSVVCFEDDIWLTRELKYNSSKYSCGCSIGNRKDGNTYDLWDIFDHIFCENTIEKGFAEPNILFSETMEDGQIFTGVIYIYEIKEIYNKHYHGVMFLD